MANRDVKKFPIGGIHLPEKKQYRYSVYLRKEKFAFNYK